jgi:hypothetical protein
MDDISGIMSLTLQDYSDKSVVVFGDTKKHKETLKEMGGKYNANLSVGAGWIFSNKKKDDIQKWVDSMKMCEYDIVIKHKFIGETKTTSVLIYLEKDSHFFHLHYVSDETDTHHILSTDINNNDLFEYIKKKIKESRDIPMHIQDDLNGIISSKTK